MRHVDDPRPAEAALPVEYVDVGDRAEIPAAPAGWRYLDFLGGTRHLRCYLVPRDLPRSRFMAEHPDQLDESLHPIYDHDGIVARQDASYALPGFYIVSLDRQYRSMDEMGELLHLRVFLILREIRAGLRNRLGVEHAHLYHEEKPDESSNVHYWLMPARTDVTEKASVIMRLDLRKYLSQFRFPTERDTICAYNRAMRDYLHAVDLRSRDALLKRHLEGQFPAEV